MMRNRRWIGMVVLLLGLMADLDATAQNVLEPGTARGDRAVATTGQVMAGSVMTDSVATDSLAVLTDSDLGLTGEDTPARGGLHQQLKRWFVEGSAGFMSLVALALVLGLACCIERMVYLTLSEVNARRLMRDVDDRLESGDVEGAKALCRRTRGPVASICYQALMHIGEPLDVIDRQLTNYGALQVSNMERGCSWIRLFIAVAPSLGFLGTVIGMVMAFDQIQTAGDISPTIVARGMKVALITTIFGIIVAVVLQFFYNYILTTIDRLTRQMEESAITLMDAVAKYQHRGEDTTPVGQMPDKAERKGGTQ